MAYLLIGALLVAGAAVVLAWRAWYVSHQVALELVRHRERLAALEKDERGERLRANLHRESASADRGISERAQHIERRLTEVERALAETLEQHESLTASVVGEAARADAGDAPTSEVREIVRRGLRRQGYRRVRIIEAVGERRVLVEAERGGIMLKGTARLDPDGDVVFQSQSTLRAFP